MYNARWPRPIRRVPPLWRGLLLCAALLPLLLVQPSTPRDTIVVSIQRVAAPSGTLNAGAVRFESTAVPPAIELFQRGTTPPAQGRVRHVAFRSAALDRTLDYWIYLPPAYDSDERRYPVLYMLHGRGGSSRQWKDLGVFAQADTLIRAHEIQPLIIVTPEGEFGYWMNHADNGPRWADYVLDDLVPHVDGVYRTTANRSGRAIGGLSMGGHGALQLALRRPELFGAVGGHSAVLRSEADAFPFFGTGATYQQRDPVSLVEQHGATIPFALWLDIGVNDPFLPRTAYFHALLERLGVAHTWHAYPGGHDAAYWQHHLPTYLRWYDQALR